MGAIKTAKIAFIGCGAMGEAILKGMLNSHLVSKEQIAIGVPTQKSRDRLQAAYGAAVYENNADAVKGADYVILAVKPQMAKKAVTTPMVRAMKKDAVVISIMGSYSLDMLHELVPDHAIVRAMPNTPLAVGKGMTALTADAAVTGDAKEDAGAIFQSCGETVWVDESAMEAITAISGCGPGYMFVIMDALADAGVMAGLPRQLAIKLAAQTMAGSGEMGLKTGLHPAQLRDQVTSPGGTTIAGIKALENHGVRGAFYDAVQAVLDRSAALKK
jgi:pyrroline-5-carboxylate reductase